MDNKLKLDAERLPGLLVQDGRGQVDVAGVLGQGEVGLFRGCVWVHFHGAFGKDDLMQFTTTAAVQ